MPELPEVETVRETLKHLIVGRTIQDITVFYDGIIKLSTVSEFKQSIIGKTVRDIRRMGKYLLFDLDDITIVNHLRMEGKYYFRETLEDVTKHDHIIFHLDNGQLLSYNDVRKFGTMQIVPLHQENMLTSILNLGPEANNPDIDFEQITQKITKSKRPIKSILLDQTVISGLGNIYVDETLFRAKINPLTKGMNLNIYQVKRIVTAAKTVLDQAIELGGTTIRSYHSVDGVDGRFQNKLYVHTHANEPCKVCKDTIQKIKVGGRGTYYCPTCQGIPDTLLIGLTGGIASGKSLIAKQFRKHGVPLLDADKIYKNLLNSNKIMYNEIIKNFGEGIIKDQRIDRKRLGQIVFTDSKKREMLNRITHPFVLQDIKRKLISLIKKGNRIIVLDIPLLFEAKMEYLVNLILVAYVDETTQIERLMERDQIDEGMATLKVKSQMNIEEKRKLADIVIDNKGTKQDTMNQFERIYQTIRSGEHVN